MVAPTQPRIEHGHEDAKLQLYDIHYSSSDMPLGRMFRGHERLGYLAWEKAYGWEKRAMPEYDAQDFYEPAVLC